MCRLNKLCCFVLLALLSVPGGLFANSYKESIKKLHDQALVCNNILLSVDEKNKALKYQIRTQKAWHDPVFDVGYINMPLTEPYLGNSPMSGVEFRLSQKFPFFGKTNARAEVARAKFQVGKRQLEEKRNSILAQISSTYVSLVLNQQLKEITGEHLTALGQFRRSVESGYRVGKGKQFQVFRLITLQEQLEDDLLQFDADEQELLEKLTGEINCSDRRVINIAKTIPVVEPGKASEVPPSNPTLEVIKSQK
ncbi:MAG: TolC family protein [Deltaproteobacteria bacterium]|nr:TolC family protein [Deltaproteobacteria bacterium]